MNEKNKNEKTFADLFSSISKIDENKSSDSNHEQTTLNDLFNQKTEEKEIKFSNLNIKEEDNVIKPELPLEEKKNEISFNNMLINSKNNETNPDNKKDFDLFDFNKQEEIKEKEEIIPKPETIEKDNKRIEERNNNTKYGEKTENNIFYNIKEENKDIEQLNSNIFTNTNTEETENTQEQETQTDNNIFTNSTSEEINMFVNSNKTEEKKLDEIETNIFLNETPTETKDNNKEVELTKENTESKEESPFFSDTALADNSTQEIDNPFFENKINLIENEKLTNNNTTIDTSNIKHFNVKIVNKKEPLIKFIIGVISYAIFILLLLIGITLLVYVADLKIKEAKGDTTPPKYNAFVVLTGSMLPEIQVYDVVITKRIDTEKLKEGDVITFSSSDSRFAGTTITHRIIKVNKPTNDNSSYTFQTKGDNNNVADSALVQANNVYGKVIFKIPKLGYLQEFLASDGGWILVILLPCLAVVSYDIVTLAKGIKRKKYKKLKVQK